jgi:hypothetical protein
MYSIQSLVMAYGADWCNYFGLVPELLLICCAPKMPQQERNKKDTNREKSQK